ncbi:hypothetical protein SRHO_G00254450 [Serrasalmus rhombeus]
MLAEGLQITDTELKGIHSLELAEGLDWRDVFLLRAPPHTGLAFLWLLPLDQWLLLRSLHAPRNHRVTAYVVVKVILQERTPETMSSPPRFWTSALTLLQMLSWWQ